MRSSFSDSCNSYKNRFSDIPLEIEFILFCAVLLHFIVGEAHDFYTEVPYYDKFVHIMLPFLIGYTGFVIKYTMYFSKRLIVSPRTMVLAVIIITMGIGAIWEIIEYSSDLFLYPVIPGWHKFQGSIAEDSFHDTMNDLVADLIGGIFGAILAFKYTWNKDEKSPRLRELLTEISNQLFRKH